MKRKKCKSCGKVKPVNKFPAHNRTADGYSVKCGDCFKRMGRPKVPKSKRKLFEVRDRKPPREIGPLNWDLPRMKKEDLSTYTKRRVTTWIENFLHLTGDYWGRPFKLLPYEREIIESIMDVKEDGIRKIKTAFISMPRKNAKSTICSSVALYILFNEPQSEIYSVAQDSSQAEIIWAIAKGMIVQNERLKNSAKILEGMSRKIIVPATGSSYKVLSSITETKYGLNPSVIFGDEVHVWSDRTLWTALTMGMGTRKQPLAVAVTTADVDEAKDTLCNYFYTYAEKTENKIITDPTFYHRIFSAPKEMDWTSEETWATSNPALYVFRDVEEIRRFCDQAKEFPSLENAFRRFYLNQRVRADSSFIPLDLWDQNCEPFDEDSLIEEPCYGGLDLAQKTDTASFVLAFNRGGKFIIKPWIWIPRIGLQKRMHDEPGVPYDVWLRQGHIIATEGDWIDFSVIESQILDLSHRYRIMEIAYDPWGSEMLAQRLSGCGLNMMKHPQKYVNFSEPTTQVMKLIKEGRINHLGHPVLRSQVSNTIIVQDSRGLIKPDRRQSTDRIDAVESMIMAIDRAIRHEKTEVSCIETEGLKFISFEDGKVTISDGLSGVEVGTIRKCPKCNADVHKDDMFCYHCQALLRGCPRHGDRYVPMEDRGNHYFCSEDGLILHKPEKKGSV